MSRLARVFGWANDRLGWWSLGLGLIILYVGIVAFVEGPGYGQDPCYRDSLGFDRTDCEAQGQTEGWFEVISAAVIATGVVLTLTPVTMLRNRLQLRRDRMDQGPRWEQVKDHYSRNGYDELASMDDVRRLRDGHEPATVGWLAGRTAMTFGILVCVCFGLLSLLGWTITATYDCEDGESYVADDCKAYKPVIATGTAGFTIAAVAGGAMAVLGSGIRVANRRKRDGLLATLDQREHAALERLRTNP